MAEIDSVLNAILEKRRASTRKNAHENIDGEIMIADIKGLLNRIDPSTLEETRTGLAPFAAKQNFLFEGETFGGEKREVHREGHPDLKGDREQNPTILNNLIKEIEMNPDFADTLTAETRPDIKTELDYSGKPFRYAKHLLGF